MRINKSVLNIFQCEVIIYLEVLMYLLLHCVYPLPSDFCSIYKYSNEKIQNIKCSLKIYWSSVWKTTFGWITLWNVCIDSRMLGFLVYKFILNLILFKFITTTGEPPLFIWTNSSSLKEHSISMLMLTNVLFYVLLFSNLIFHQLVTIISIWELPVVLIKVT